MPATLAYHNDTYNSKINNVNINGHASNHYAVIFGTDTLFINKN